MDLQEWFMTEFQNNNNDLYYKVSAEVDIMWMRDVIGNFFSTNFDVIGTHKSKSVLLPVMQLSTDSVTLTIRYNFHNFAVSVDSKKDVPWVFDGLFDSKTTSASCYFEGFQKGIVYGSYDSNPRQFSFHVRSKEQFYVFCFLMDRAFSEIPN